MKLSSIIASLEIIIRDAPQAGTRTGEMVRALKALIALLKEEDSKSPHKTEAQAE